MKFMVRLATEALKASSDKNVDTLHIFGTAKSCLVLSLCY